jgi:hypothetical protein
MFKIWCQELSEDRDYDPNFPIDRELGFQWDQYIFGEGTIPSCELSFNVSDDIVENDFFKGEGIPIVSDRIKSILTKETPGIASFFPVKIFDKQKEVYQNKFFAIKIENEIECFDWDNSDYSTRKLNNGVKRISAIRNLVLMEDKIENQTVFKIAETNYFLVGVREDLCRKILDGGVKGIEFRELSEVLR